MHHFETALTDFNQALLQNPDNPDVLFFKAKSQLYLNQIDDAILNFEQVFNQTPDERQASNALLEIATIRVKEKDFYEAYHLLN